MPVDHFLFLLVVLSYRYNLAHSTPLFLKGEVGFKVLIWSISYNKQSNLFLHFLRTSKHFSRSWGIVPCTKPERAIGLYSCESICIIFAPIMLIFRATSLKYCYLHILNFYIDNGVMTTPKRRILSFDSNCVGNFITIFILSILF